MIRCKKCGDWEKDGNGGWGVCRNELTAQNVEHWKRHKTLTFETFGCVYGHKEVRKEAGSDSDRVPAHNLKAVAFPDCACKCALVEIMGVGECESACPWKFNHTGDNGLAGQSLGAAHGYAAGLEVCEGFAALHPNNCAIRERTADGVSVGPCTFHLENGTTCPRHGNVKPHNSITGG